MPPSIRIPGQETRDRPANSGGNRTSDLAGQDPHPILQLQTTLGNLQAQTLLAGVAGAPVALRRKVDPKACMAQTDEILPNVGVVASIDRDVTLTDTLGAEYGPLKQSILANVQARQFVCDAGVPAILALWDTRDAAGALDVKAAVDALAQDQQKLYAQNLDTSWMRRRRIARARGELEEVASWVNTEEKTTALPQLLLRTWPVPERGNVTAAAANLDTLVKVFESATTEFTAAANSAFELRELLNEAKNEAIKARANPDYAGGAREPLEKAETRARSLVQQLEAAHRGFDIGDLVQTSMELTGAVAKLRRSSGSVDGETIRQVWTAVNGFRQKVAAGSAQATDLAGAAQRVSFVLRYAAALNTPGFANAPGKDEVKAMRDKLRLSLISSDLELLFGPGADRSLNFVVGLNNQIQLQLEERKTIETAIGRDTALVPEQPDVVGFFQTLAHSGNDQVIAAYENYAQAFFQHRIVTNLSDLSLTGLNEIFGLPLSMAGLRPLVCTGYATLGANLLAAAGGRTVTFIVAVRASADQLRTNRLDDGHAVAVVARGGATLYVSNHTVVRNENDAIGPDAVAWDHKNFPLISARGNTVQNAIAALGVELARH